MRQFGSRIASRSRTRDQSKTSWRRSSPRATSSLLDVAYKIEDDGLVLHWLITQRDPAAWGPVIDWLRQAAENPYSLAYRTLPGYNPPVFASFAGEVAHLTFIVAEDPEPVVVIVDIWPREGDGPSPN